LSDGRLVIHSGIPLGEAAMREIEAWGTPAFIVVPNRFHRIDAPAYKARYPNAKLLCDASVTAQVAEVVPVDGTFADLPSDPTLRHEPVAGVEGGEQVFFVTSAGGRVSLVVNDMLFNHPHVAGFGGLILRVLGSSGGPRVTRVARTLMRIDRPALRAQLLALAETPNLVRIVVSHVDVIDHEPAAVLHQVAGTL
jgi:hypothetical protein